MLIIHGDNQSASRDRFLEIKLRESSAGKQIIELAGPGLTLSELKNKAGSSSLLGNVNSIFITDLFSGRPGHEKKLISDFLLTQSAADIYVWESRDISLQLQKFPPKVIQKYDLPKYIFQFLDHPTLALLDRSLANSAPEQIFSLLVVHFRKLLIVKNHSGIYPSWQKSKLELQASSYHLEDLMKRYRELLEIDYRQKTSSSPYNLVFSLELWVSRL